MSKAVSFIAKVQELGRIAIPKAIREAYGIKKGDRLKVTIKKEE